MNDPTSFYFRFKKDICQEDLSFFCLLSPAELDFTKKYYECLVLQCFGIPDKQDQLEAKHIVIEHIANYKNEVLNPDGSLLYKAYLDETLEYVELSQRSQNYNENDFSKTTDDFLKLSKRHSSVKNYYELLGAMSSRIANNKFNNIPVLPLKTENSFNYTQRIDLPLLIKNRLISHILKMEDISPVMQFLINQKKRKFS